MVILSKPVRSSGSRYFSCGVVHVTHFVRSVVYVVFAMAVFVLVLVAQAAHGSAKRLSAAQPLLASPGAWPAVADVHKVTSTPAAHCV